MLQPLAILFGLAIHFADVSPPTQAAMKKAADYSEEYRGQTCVVMFEGEIVFSQYAAGGRPDQPQMLASGSKSFVGLAAVAAVQDGHLQLDAPVSESIPEWNDASDKRSVTYRQLLNLTSGLTGGARERPNEMPAWKETAARPLFGKPGEQFSYGAHHLNTFAYALERKLGNETFEAYLKRRIFDPIGIRVEWRIRCRDGHPQVGGGAFATAADWAKFGELVRTGGNWKGQSVLDATAVTCCFEGSSSNPAYGLTWWLRKPVTQEQRRSITILSTEWADAANADWLPKDLVAACGAGKQRLYVIPSLKLVIVRQGTFGRGFADVEFLRLMLSTDRGE